MAWHKEDGPYEMSLSEHMQSCAYNLASTFDPSINPDSALDWMNTPEAKDWEIREVKEIILR